MTSDDRFDSIVLARRVANLARERRGTDVVVLDVRTLVDYADAFLVLTGQSTRQNLAIAEHIVKSLKAEQKYAISKSGLDSGSWICLDLGDIVVHIFDPETRARYDLELLWADAPRVDLGPAPAVIDVSGVPAVTDTPSEGTASEDDADLAPADDESPKKSKRRRAVRRAAVEEADADNAPESERPTDEELAAELDAAPEGASEPEVATPRRKGASKRAPSAAEVPAGKRSAKPAPPSWLVNPPAAEKWVPIRSVPSKKSLPQKPPPAKVRIARSGATKSKTPIAPIVKGARGQKGPKRTKSPSKKSPSKKPTPKKSAPKSKR